MATWCDGRRLMLSTSQQESAEDARATLETEMESAKLAVEHATYARQEAELGLQVRPTASVCDDVFQHSPLPLSWLRSGSRASPSLLPGC